MKLVTFIACKTANGYETLPTLPSVAVSRGAKTAVGFEESIDCATANKWTIKFFEYMESGATVKDACSTLALEAKYRVGGLDSYQIFGDHYIVLN